MQTNFTAKQLEDPRAAEAESILRRCVHCGLCTATCSTYVMLGDERDSPRGRIYLMKDMFERDVRASTEVQHHVDRCLSCLSCMTTCPSGVDYMHLVDLARAHIEETGHRSLPERLVRWTLAYLIPHPERFRRALALAPMGRPFAPLLKRLGLPQVEAMLALAPKTPIREPRYQGPGTASAAPLEEGERRKRVILLAGCAQQVLRPEINDATIRLLARRGVDVEVAAGAGCCGALVHHMGKEAMAVAQAKANVDAWVKAMSKAPVDAILINASGCGTMVKDYGHLLKAHPGHARRAAEISALAKDVTEFLAEHDLGAPKRWSSLRVAYHSACSMQHGQRIIDEPKALLRKAGFTVLDVPEGHICCGSAGVYNILQPELAGQLRQRKVDNIESVRPDIIAAGNLGCITQIQLGTPIPVVHTIELVDWACGGPIPKGLEKFEGAVTDVPQPAAAAE
ncbi:MAG: glycolate oxidase subunit GlcF [Hyphomicrobiaceae bacterium]|nr:glycolate oxidase subunit GlcF [Hyphomicrobiaceae bacterium]